MLPFTFDFTRHALFLDLDGTVIDIAATPQSVAVPTGLADDIARVAVRLDGALAVLSGRPIADIDRLLAPFCARAAGVHGAEIRLSPAGPLTQLAPPLPPHLVEEIATLAAEPGVLVENKNATIAVHFRNAVPASGEEIQRRLTALVARCEDVDLALLLGKCVAEIKPRRLGKGTAVATFMELSEFASRLPVVIGDDVTDEAAFEMAGRFGGFGVAVGQPRPGAAFVVSSPDAVRAWLAQLAEGV